MARLLNLETSEEVKNIIEAGYVLKPHGIRGKLKVKIYDEFVSFFKNIPVFIDNKKYTCESIKVVPNDIFIMALKEVKNRDMSEDLSGKKLFIESEVYEKQVELQPDDFTQESILGMEVWTHQGLFLGKVSNTFKTDFSDYIETDNGHIIPFMKRYIIEISVENNRIDIQWEEDDED
ncbi:MAG: 16S rRNA processing protein RimM [Candidatus Muiribacterium halophilum]|uniref:Ribosome maturation factor RimM n=1 Tax=Muiribacterium halophilum TaxID=2053465 RepID=A0A2N5ZIX0_MUIH1|nr:MAG: 16S rRNA processing protein RimM [Candidatus Muirbacterium halophilum]